MFNVSCPVTCLTDVAVIEMCRFFSLNFNDLHGRPLKALTGQVGAWTKLEILLYVSLYIDLIMTDVELTTVNLVISRSINTSPTCHKRILVTETFVVRVDVDIL